MGLCRPTRREEYIKLNGQNYMENSQIFKDLLLMKTGPQGLDSEEFIVRTFNYR